MNHPKDWNRHIAKWTPWRVTRNRDWNIIRCAFQFASLNRWLIQISTAGLRPGSWKGGSEVCVWECFVVSLSDLVADWGHQGGGVGSYPTSAFCRRGWAEKTQGTQAESWTKQIKACPSERRVSQPHWGRQRVRDPRRRDRAPFYSSVGIRVCHPSLASVPLRLAQIIVQVW